MFVTEVFLLLLSSFISSDVKLCKSYNKSKISKQKMYEKILRININIINPVWVNKIVVAAVMTSCLIFMQFNWRVAKSMHNLSLIATNLCFPRMTSPETLESFSYAILNFVWKTADQALAARLHASHAPRDLPHGEGWSGSFFAGNS